MIEIHPLQQARRKLGIKQHVLADLTGLSTPTIKRAERGEKLSPFTITQLCNFFATRWKRPVEPKELGLVYGDKNTEELENFSDDEHDVTTSTHSKDQQPSSSVNLPNKSNVAPISAREELLLKSETRDWSIWAGLKLAQIFKLTSSYNGQSHSCEEICEEIQTFLEQEIKMLDDMLPQNHMRETYLISRQQALIMIAALPSTLQNWTLGAHNLAAQEFLPQCAASVTACWHLLQGKGLAAVEEILATYMPTLMTLALRSSKYQTAAARLATLANMLRAIIAKHRLKDADREKYCHEAVRCSNFAHEKRLQAVALMFLGYTYLFCTPLRPQKAVETLQNALKALGNEDSLLRSDIYIGLADAHVQCQEEREALQCMTLAQNHFPTHPEHDSSFLYADCSLPVLYQWEGKMSLHLAANFPSKDYYQRAWNAFTQAAETHPLHDRGTSEIIIDQADVARGMGELSIYTEYLRKGVQLAVTLGSQRRYNEAYAIYQQTPSKWLSEKQILTLSKDIFGGQLPKGK
jgi:transcriptional regulator with XRE-family HTH domain